MIDGLRLTIPGEEIRRLLEERIGDHEARAAHWRAELDRTEEDEEHPMLPDHICENEALRHEWRVRVLAFMRERIESAEIYRLGENDLAFGELLPEKPGWMEQDEFEERTRVGFQLERLVKTVGSELPVLSEMLASQKSGT